MVSKEIFFRYNLCITEIMQQVELRRKINEQALSGTPVHKADTRFSPSVSLQTLSGNKGDKLRSSGSDNHYDTHHRS